jgi:hypothetical protein
MRTRKMLVLLLLSSMLYLMSSCVTTQQAVIPTACSPEGYILLKKDILIDLMESCARTKSELNECLEREKVK